MIGCGHMVDCYEVDNKTSRTIEVVELFDSGFAATEGFCSNVLDAINRLM